MTDAEIAQTIAAVLDRGGGRPLSRQIADVLWEAVIDGSVPVGRRIPTVRALAIDLGVPPVVVERAYAELERRGVVAVQPGGTFVALSPGDADARDRARALETACTELADRADALGFTLDDVIDTLSDLRSMRGPAAREKGEQ